MKGLILSIIIVLTLAAIVWLQDAAEAQAQDQRACVVSLKVSYDAWKAWSVEFDKDFFRGAVSAKQHKAIVAQAGALAARVREYADDAGTRAAYLALGLDTISETWVLPPRSLSAKALKAARRATANMRTMCMEPVEEERTNESI